MVKWIAKLWIVLAAAALGGSGALAASFTATLDRDSMELGETANFALTFEGGQPGNMAAPEVPGLVFTQGETSQNASINIGGSGNSVSATITVNFTVTAQRTGSFTIPAMVATMNGQQLSTQPIHLTVTKAEAPSAAAINSGSEPAFMRLVVPSKRLYIGEPMVAQVQLYLRDDVMNQGNFDMPSVPSDGLATGKIVQLQQRRRAQAGNHMYTVITLGVPVTPLKTGNLTLGPFTGSIVVVLPTQGGGGWFFNQGEQRQVPLTTDPVTIESLPLPDQGKPANFSGAVGQFTMTATAGPTNVVVGDPVTVRVQIAGTGSFDAVTLPAQTAWHDFKLYPATTKTETTDQFGFQGTKTFEQIVSPLNADVKELPGVSFSYFNPDQGKYVTLTQPAVSLVVSAAGAVPMPAVAAKTAAPENQAPADIMPIKESLGTLVESRTPLYARPAFVAAQSLPVAAFLAALVWRRRTDNLANNPRLRRKRAVAQIVTLGLDDLRKFAAQNKPDEFFALLFRLLQEQLGERLDCPATAITESAADDRLIRMGAAPGTMSELREFFQLCDQARYAPVRGTSELNSLQARFQKLLGELHVLKA